MNKQVEIFLPEDAFGILVSDGIITKSPAQERAGDFCANIGRVVSWMTTRDCAIISGWRGDNTRQENDNNNREIQTTLRKYGFGVCKARGCYAEVGMETSHENSFFVFEYNPQGTLFEKVKELAEKFEQDCFLFKEAGQGSRAFLYGTNDAFGRGRRVEVGELRLGADDSQAYTRVGGGKFSFE